MYYTLIFISSLFSSLLSLYLIFFMINLKKMSTCSFIFIIFVNLLISFQKKTGKSETKDLNPEQILFLEKPGTRPCQKSGTVPAKPRRMFTLT